MKNYSMYLDDIREPKQAYDVVVRSYSEAVSYIQTNGMPNYISFDHDLGANEEGTLLKSGYDLAKWLIESALDKELEFPSDFRFNVHSANPVGKKNIISLLDGYIKYNNRRYKMRAVNIEELQKEFEQIVSCNENDINLDTADLQLLIDASKNQKFLFGMGESKSAMSAYDALILALEPLEYVHEHKSYMVHFKINPNYPLLKISEAMEIIHEVAHENADIVFGTTGDEMLSDDYVQVKVFIAID